MASRRAQRTARVVKLLAFGGIALVTSSCGGSAREAESAPPHDEAESAEAWDTEPQSAEPEAAPPSTDAGPVTEPSGGTKANAAPPPSREVVYRMTSEGLVVEADGVRFKPSAKPVTLPNGGYGIELKVETEVLDQRAHTLLSPPHGPLSLAAVIRDKNDQPVAQHGDKRQPTSAGGQDDMEILTPGATVTLERKWPSGNVKGPLWWGQKVRLMVGLWGLGSEEENPRPLKKLFVVDMVGGAKAQALIQPPDV